MKKTMGLICFIALWFACCTAVASEIKETSDEIGARLLPHNFTVFVNGNTVINHPAAGFEKRALPTINHYPGDDGGYVAVYTRQKEGAVYSIGGGIYVAGQIRVKGRYIGRLFYPEGYWEGDNITQDPAILSLCHQYFPEFGDDVWIGGDTGGWFVAQ